MPARTIRAVVAAPCATVFAFLADIENLPKWAGAYCERIALERGRWWALTAEGEQVLEMDTDAGRGIIDFRAGARPERMTPTPIRLFALGARQTLVSLTVMESSDPAVMEFERRYQLWLAAGDELLRRFSGGDLRVPAAAAQLVELALN